MSGRVADVGLTIGMKLITTAVTICRIWTAIGKRKNSNDAKLFFAVPSINNRKFSLNYVESL